MRFVAQMAVPVGVPFAPTKKVEMTAGYPWSGDCEHEQREGTTTRRFRSPFFLRPPLAACGRGTDLAGRHVWMRWVHRPLQRSLGGLHVPLVPSPAAVRPAHQLASLTSLDHSGGER